jgi:hypothetical protein
MALHLTFCRNNPPTPCDSELRELARTLERGYERDRPATNAVVDALRRLAG